jgi:hypothetical protein
MSKQFKKLVAGFTAIIMVGAMVPATMAASVTNLTVTQTDHSQYTSNDLSLSFGTQVDLGVYDNHIIKIYLEDQDFSGVDDFADINLSVVDEDSGAFTIQNTAGGSFPSHAGTHVDFITDDLAGLANGTLELRFRADAGALVNTNDADELLITFTIGNGVPGSHSVVVGLDDGAEVGMGAYTVVADSTLSISADVPAYITLAISNTDIDFGVMDNTTLSTSTSQFSIDTNADSGYVLNYEATPLASTTNASNIITALAGAGVSAGVEGWGVNLVSNSTPSVGSNFSAMQGATITLESAYATTNEFYVDTTDTTQSVASANGPSGDHTITMSFAAGVGALTEAGHYQGEMEILLTGQF